MANHHDTGYKELFSYPEFVQQLIEGFAPQEIAQVKHSHKSFSLADCFILQPLTEEYRNTFV